MLYSVHDLPRRLDLFNRADWQSRTDQPTPKLETEIAYSRDPLHWPEFGLEFHAIWGFDAETKQLRILLGDPIESFSGFSSRYDDRRNRIQFFAALAPRLVSLAPFSPSLENVLAIIAPDGESPLGSFHKFRNEVRALLTGDYVLEWAHGNELIMAALLDRSTAWMIKNGSSVPIDGFKEKFKSSIGRLYDYYFYKQRLLRFVPTRLFSCDDSNTDLIIRVFSDPLAFDPREEIPKGAFLWPWQRSIGYRTRADGVAEVYYRSITTTSLVLDIRASTTAMDLSIDSAAFAQLIDDIVEEARQIIVRHDGFFDKETGDGVVGHFCHATSTTIPSVSGSQSSPNVPFRAVQAAVEVVKSVQLRCKAYQRFLIHGLDGLGPAVGIHTGQAVWLADGSQIRAIGPAVVGAARLCGRADASEIVLSNQSFQEYAKGIPAANLAAFEKKNIEIKEYNQKLGLYGHVIRL